MQRVLLVMCGAGSLLALALPSQALAKRKPPVVPPGMASVAQYIEVLPTSVGPKEFKGPNSSVHATPTTTRAVNPAPGDTTSTNPNPVAHSKARPLRRSPRASRARSHLLDGVSTPSRASPVGDFGGAVSPFTALVLVALVGGTVVAVLQRPRRDQR